MPKILIAYDLIQDAANPKWGKVAAEIKRHWPGAEKPLETTWIISGPDSSDSVARVISGLLDSNDGFVVAEIEGAPYVQPRGGPAEAVAQILRRVNPSVARKR